MYNISKQNVFDYKSKIYIAKYLETIEDDDLNQFKVYDKPIKYIFNVQPASADSEIKEFGELANSMRVAVIPKTKYNGKFNEFDAVYIDNSPENEINNGDKADYRIYSVRPQNMCIRVYFLKIVK